MPTEIFDSQTVFGPDYQISAPVLGRSYIAEGLVSWAAKNKPGTTFSRTTPWGLTVRAVAATEPVVQLFLDIEKLHAFLKGWGPLGQLMIQSYGIKLCGPLNVGQHEALQSEGTTVAVALPIGNGDKRALAVVSPTDAAEIRYLGSIVLGEAMYFYAAEEELPHVLTPITTPVVHTTRAPTTRRAAPVREPRHQEVSMSCSNEADEAEEAAARWEAQ